MATQKIQLSSAWSLVTSTSFIGQIDGSKQVFIRNDTVIPTVNAAHVVNADQNLSFPAPLAGNWYARVQKGNASLTYTEV